MPIVNVHAKKVIRGLKQPFVGTKKGINLTEEQIKICKIYGATVEYVDEQPAKVVEETVIPPVEDKKDDTVDQTPEESVEDKKDDTTVDETPVEETPTEEPTEEVEEPVEDQTEETAPVEDVQEKVSQNKNTGKKKNK